VSASPANVRQMVEAAILAVLGPDTATPIPSRLSSLAWEAFPGADLRDAEACSFAVGLPGSVALPGRQRGQAGGQPTTSQLGVRWSWSVAADRHVADYDAGLDREALLVRAVTGTPFVGFPRPRFVSATRSLRGDGTLLVGDLLFAVFHTYPL
jgi:hypothetical protein